MTFFIIWFYSVVRQKIEKMVFVYYYKIERCCIVILYPAGAGGVKIQVWAEVFDQSVIQSG